MLVSTRPTTSFADSQLLVGLLSKSTISKNDSPGEKTRRHVSPFRRMEAEWTKSKRVLSGAGVAYYVFHYWYKRYRQQRAEAPVASFKAIALPAHRQMGTALEVALPDGRVLSFFHPLDASLIKALLQ